MLLKKNGVIFDIFFILLALVQTDNPTKTGPKIGKELHNIQQKIRKKAEWVVKKPD